MTQPTEAEKWPEVFGDAEDDDSPRGAAATLPQNWDKVMTAIGDLPDLLVGAPEAESAEGVRYLLRFLSAGLRICIEADDADAPMLTRSIENRMSWGLDNPDTTYLYTRLDPGGTYRLHGSKGTARHFEIQVNTGHQGDGDVQGWKANLWWRGDDLSEEIDIEIPPTEDASFLFIRQYFSDWATEIPATLNVERLDLPLPPNPIDNDSIDARLGLLATWLREGASGWDQISRAFLDGMAPDASESEIQPFMASTEGSGLKGQAYGMGAWRCEPGEAVVITVAPPRSRYWSLSLCDRYWQSIDYAQRQSSLNDSQAVPDETEDGTFSFVISHQDPGVANWLDPGGKTGGTLAVRYLLPETDPTAVTQHRVSLTDLDDQLPAGAAKTDPASRQKLLRDRQQQIAERLRW